jgi:DNA-binding Lrp family transcriptional regulator
MPAALDVLEVAFRARPQTVADLAGLMKLTEDELRPALDRLVAAGLLTLDGAALRYPDAPSRALAQHATDLLGAAEQRLATDLDETRALLSWLPRLLVDATADDASGDVLPIEVLHGPGAPEALWQLQVARRPPRSSDAVLPDARRVYKVDPDLRTPARRVLSEPGRQGRGILSVRDATHPDAREQIALNVAAGIDFRMHPSPPSWFWIIDDDTVGLPLRWGEAWPTSVMAIRHPAVAALASHVFDRLWAASSPLQPTDQGWDPLLRLMREGATAETAAAALGISERTGRRRIADAMDHYDTRTLFGLGVAWAADQERDGAA